MVCKHPDEQTTIRLQDPWGYGYCYQCCKVFPIAGMSGDAKDADHSAEPVDSPTTAAPWSFTAQDEADTSMEEGDMGGPVISPPAKPTYHKAMDYVRIMGGRK